jgi:hypothetical protein
MSAKTPFFDENTGLAAYKALLSLFKSQQNELLELEILPPSVQPPVGDFYIQEDNSVGISKKALLSAFLAARIQFDAQTADSRLRDEVRWLR